MASKAPHIHDDSQEAQRARSNRSFGLVLAGGGARGMAHVGARDPAP